MIPEDLGVGWDPGKMDGLPLVRRAPMGCRAMPGEKWAA